MRKSRTLSRRGAIMPNFNFWILYLPITVFLSFLVGWMARPRRSVYGSAKVMATVLSIGFFCLLMIESLDGSIQLVLNFLGPDHSGDGAITVAIILIFAASFIHGVIVFAACGIGRCVKIYDECGLEELEAALEGNEEEIEER